MTFQTIRQGIALASLILTLVACSTLPETKKQVIYQCDRGSVLDVTFIERSYSTIHGGKHSKRRYHQEMVASVINKTTGQTISLPAREVDTGFMYSDGRHTLRGKGSEATWTIGGMISEYCVVS